MSATILEFKRKELTIEDQKKAINLLFEGSKLCDQIIKDKEATGVVDINKIQEYNRIVRQIKRINPKYEALSLMSED